jgi:hypothetical protein
MSDKALEAALERLRVAAHRRLFRRHGVEVEAKALTELVRAHSDDEVFAYLKMRTGPRRIIHWFGAIWRKRFEG